MHTRKRKNGKAELNTLPTILSHPFLVLYCFGLSFYPIAQSLFESPPLASSPRSLPSHPTLRGNESYGAGVFCSRQNPYSG